MADTSVPEGLWNLIEPLLALPRPKPKGGRPRVPNRACLRGVVFVLRSGIPWEMLPKESGCGFGMTCWRRLRDWQEAGVWDLIQFALLDWLARYSRIDWSKAIVDSRSIRAVFGGSRQDRTLLIAARSATWSALQFLIRAHLFVLRPDLSNLVSRRCGPAVAFCLARGHSGIGAEFGGPFPAGETERPPACLHRPLT